MSRSYWIGGVCLLLAVVVYTQITIFVIQPIGAAPEGRTVVLWRKSQGLSFVDSADGLCKRYVDGVSLLCRGMALSTIAKDNPVLLRLPYSDILYSISTGGETYDR